MKHLKILILGGAGSGKTTLINELSKQGFATCGEGAILVIKDLIEECGGVKEQMDWRQNHQKEFQEKIMLKQIELEMDCIESVVFYDRGLLDCYTMSRFRRNPFPEGLGQSIYDAKYDFAFILETISPFPERGGTGRTSPEIASKVQGEMLKEDCDRFGISYLWIPMGSLQERLLSVLAKTLMLNTKHYEPELCSMHYQ